MSKEIQTGEAPTPDRVVRRAAGVLLRAGERAGGDPSRIGGVTGATIEDLRNPDLAAQQEAWAQASAMVRAARTSGRCLGRRGR
jgi:hypothetical protein